MTRTNVYATRDGGILCSNAPGAGGRLLGVGFCIILGAETSSSLLLRCKTRVLSRSRCLS